MPARYRCSPLRHVRRWYIRPSRASTSFLESPMGRHSSFRVQEEQTVLRWMLLRTACEAIQLSVAYGEMRFPRLYLVLRAQPCGLGVANAQYGMNFDLDQTDWHVRAA